MQAMKTIRQELRYDLEVESWFAATQTLFNQIVSFYFSVIEAHSHVLDLNAQQGLTTLERLTHATANNPSPAMPLPVFDVPLPVRFRRAAINQAIGDAHSFHTKLTQWKTAKAKAAEQEKPFNTRPTRPPKHWNHAVTFYAKQWRDRTPASIRLRLWTGATWQWVRCEIQGRAFPDGWQSLSPSVVRHGRRWWIHTPVAHTAISAGAIAKQVMQDTTRLCGIDLNMTEQQAICTILGVDGTVHATRFIGGGRELDSQRQMLLGRIARNQRATVITQKGVSNNKDLWSKLRAIDENAAHRISRRIVEFAQEHHATILVFEHLVTLKPEKGRYSHRANSMRSWWLRGRIYRYAMYKAWESGIVTTRVNPRDTSRLCARCQSAVLRYDVRRNNTTYRYGAPLVRCETCGMQGNAERNASINIGQRLLSYYTR